MFGLILYTTRINRSFIFFSLFIIISGFLIELIGVKTGNLFGDYAYGNALGPKLMDIPVIIGFNWLVVIYCSGCFVNMLFDKFQQAKPGSTANLNFFRKFAVVFDGACVALLLDWIMEPVAVKLDFWTWGGDGTIPLFNYVCWFVISAIMLTVFQYLAIDKRNKFAVNLLLIQAMFFLLLRNLL